MAKTTVKDFRKSIKAMLDKHQKPPEMNPIDQMIEMARKMNKGGMN